MRTMSRLRRRSLGSHTGYTPGEQPAEGEAWLKLNTNEAALPPSPLVAPAIAAAAVDLRRYPHPLAEPLRTALARHHGVEPERVLVGNGADDILEWCVRAFVDPGDVVAYPVPSYSLLPVLVQQQGGVGVEVPLDSGARCPAELSSVAAALTVIVNPNAPTGTWLPPDELEARLGGAPGAVVVDEAYGDFAPASCLPLLDRHPTWIVVRSFSKGYALAGLRVGYAVASAAVIADLCAVKDSYPVDRCAIAGALAALTDSTHHERLVATVRTQRHRLTRELAELGWAVLPSEANFVYARPPVDAGDVLRTLREQRILVRHFPGGEWGRWLRITVGAPGENDRLLDALHASAGTGRRPAAGR